MEPVTTVARPQSGLTLLFAYLALAGAIFMLQLLPITGIFLMLLAAPIWIGLLMHFAMAHFALLAAVGQISRVWLALPFSVYAGGLALHLLSVKAAEFEAAAINVKNETVRLDVEQPFRYLRDGNLGSLSYTLIEQFRVERSFTRAGKDKANADYYAQGEACENAAPGSILKKDIFNYYNGNKTRQCILEQRGAPANWRYRITGNSTYEKDHATWLFERHGHTFEIYDERDNALLGTIELATFMPFPIFPLVVAGCGLGQASWDCEVSLLKYGTTVAGGYGVRDPHDPMVGYISSSDPDAWDLTQLGKALGLELRQPTD